ncbi:MAG: ribosome maturation factor RimM [Christensenellaceae bacterium]
MTQYFELGQILKPQGIKGEVKIDAYTDDISRFEGLEFLYFKENSSYQKVNIETVRIDHKYAYIKFLHIKDRNDAELLRGKMIYIDRANAAKLPEGAFYIQDLIGLEVLDNHGTSLGVLKDITKTGASDVYVVLTKNHGTCMFPSVNNVILSRDLETGQIIVDAEKLEEVCLYDI